MHRIEIKREMRAGDVSAVRGLLDSAAAADAHAALDEHAWLDLVHGGREGFAGLVAWEEGHPHPVGYAQVSRGALAGNWALEFVVDPHHRVPGNTIGLDLVRAAVEVIASEGGGHVHMWVNQPRPDHDQIAAAVGLQPGRVLYQMRRPLPVPDSLRLAPPLETRTFRVGVDETVWLEVNNRAFDWHPEQGGWDRATIHQREAEPWFDPAGFLLHENESGQVDGFCWTKIHKDTDPPLGEIYVIAGDPARTDRTPGLGRRLVIAGLDYLSGRGLTMGMLYVDADNGPAVKLYIDLGFVVNHLDQAYVGDVAPASLDAVLMAGAYDLSQTDVAEVLEGEPAYRIGQVWRALYEHGYRPSEMTDLPRGLRSRLEDALPPSLLLAASTVADGGQTLKWLWALEDGARIETVLMHYPDRATVCVSSQAGCAMGCTFCATGQGGFSRHLTVGEIVEQVVVARRAALPSRLSNVVFMGMGEPLANYDQVWGAIERLHADVGLSARHLTVSTVGVVPGIRRLATEALPVNLAVSLHAANDRLRSRLVPLNKRYPLGVLVEACRQYVTAKGRRLSFEWALIAGVNDRPSDAIELASLTGPLGAHVNLIPLNPTPGYPARGTSQAGVRLFRDHLIELGVNATVRRNRGTDIDAACGQLAARAVTPGVAGAVPVELRAAAQAGGAATGASRAATGASRAATGASRAATGASRAPTASRAPASSGTSVRMPN